MTAAVAEYQAWVAEQVDQTIAATTTFTDAVRAGDLDGAKRDQPRQLQLRPAGRRARHAADVTAAVRSEGEPPAA
ncbi:MAG: hypothetical protein ACRDGH_05775 [Candidatus Limnocylindria bacterium]